METNAGWQTGLINSEFHTDQEYIRIIWLFGHCKHYDKSDILARVLNDILSSEVTSLIILELELE